jgi:organic anion transporter 4A
MSQALQSCPSPENQTGAFRYVFFFCLAHFLHGIGATPLFTIGVSYIDENVGPNLSSLYLGVFYAFAIFGPALGFVASSISLRWHTDFLQTGKQFAK